ncbi:hypothetical protein AMK32_24860 [Streptomyces sp. CB01883]|nr:hypothetical protein AMK32_24860 [Streptomyces sp. CB01883]
MTAASARRAVVPPARVTVAMRAPTPSAALRRARAAASAVSRSRPWATVATSAAWAAGQDWLPIPRKSAAAANGQTCPAGVASSSATPSTRTSIDAATTVLRAPRSSHRPTAGTHTRPATTPAVMAVPVAGADSSSTVTPYRSRNGRSRPVPSASTARARA